MSDYHARAQLVLLEVNRLVLEAERAQSQGDHQRVIDIEPEVRLLYNNILEIRREQLRGDLTPPKKRRFWQREEVPA